MTTFALIQELEFLPLGDHYQQVLDQALELYALTDPDASDDVVQTTAMEAAWKDTLAEALRIQRALPRPQQWPPGWAGIMQEAQEMWAKDQGQALQVDAEVRDLPRARRSRARRAPEAEDDLVR